MLRLAHVHIILILIIIDLIQYQCHKNRNCTHHYILYSKYTT